MNMTKARTYKNVRESIQVSVVIRSQSGLEVLAFCRSNRISLSGVIDRLLEINARDLLRSQGRTIVLIEKLFEWPKPWGLR